MTNPADVLTDEFIKRVACRIAARVQANGVSGVTMRDGVIRSAKEILIEEREPVQTLTFEIRAESPGMALAKLTAAMNEPNSFYPRSDIRLVELS